MALNKAERAKLTIEIRQMTRDTKLFKLLKTELQAQGYWKNKARGNPQRGYKVSRDRA